MLGNFAVRLAWGAVLLAGLLPGCATQKYPIDATLSCDCAPDDQRVRGIIAIAENAGYVRDPRWERVWPDPGHAEGRRVTLAYLTLKSSSDIELMVTDYGGKLVVFMKIKRYYSPVTDAENDLLLNFESALARQQPGMWTEHRRDFKSNIIDVNRKL